MTGQNCNNFHTQNCVQMWCHLLGQLQTQSTKDPGSIAFELHSMQCKSTPVWLQRAAVCCYLQTACVLLLFSFNWQLPINNIKPLLAFWGRKNAIASLRGRTRWINQTLESIASPVAPFLAIKNIILWRQQEWSLYCGFLVGKLTARNFFFFLLNLVTSDNPDIGGRKTDGHFTILMRTGAYLFVPFHKRKSFLLIYFTRSEQNTLARYEIGSSA